MDESKPAPQPGRQRGIRWWPGLLILAETGAVLAWVQSRDGWPFQQRNLTSAKALIVSGILLVIWWAFFSRAPRKPRWAVLFGLVGVALAGAALFRISGVSGDLMPIIEFRWAQPTTLRDQPAVSTNQLAGSAPLLPPATNIFPQFLGPRRDGVLPGPRLATNWAAHPPDLIWRRPVGAAWSGFAIAGSVALTQEQRGAEECVVALDLGSGQTVWSHRDIAHYDTTIAGEGPRATPTIDGGRVFTLGATGILNCLDLATGRLVWARDVIKGTRAGILSWGCSGSPLVVDKLVIVPGGEGAGRSLVAFFVEDGQPAWTGGTKDASYASPLLATLAGVRQVVTFNAGTISGYDPDTGATLWERPWGNGNVVCSSPVVAGSNRVVFSSGYGYGAELIELSAVASGRLEAQRLWKSIRMKSKFGHLFVRDGFLYGLDDGQFACVDLQDGSLRWKEGRYGHGQGLLVGDLYLLMAESGELVLLQPTPEAPHELARYRVFDAKTWNPIALAGDLLLVRNDREAACLRLPLAP